MNVLLRAPNWIGDAVLALPAVAALAARRDVRLTVVAPPYVHPVYEGLPGVALSPIDPRVRLHRPLQAVAVGRALAGDDEVGIVCPASFSSALVMRLAGVPRRVGRATDGRSRLLTETLPPRPAPPFPLRPRPGGSIGEAAQDALPPPRGGAAAGGSAPAGARPAVARPAARTAGHDRRFHRWRDYAELVEHVLEQEVAEDYRLHVAPAALARADALLAPVSGGGPLVGLNPGANGPARRWPAVRYAALGLALRERLDARVAVLGGPGDRELAEGLAAVIPGARSLAARTSLKVLMAALSRLDFLVTNDTGPMHLAAALGTPLLDLCGAADERVTAPRGPRARVLREQLFCSPCVRNACPYDLECMEALGVERVLEESLAALAEARAR